MRERKCEREREREVLTAKAMPEFVGSLMISKFLILGSLMISNFLME